MFRMRRMDADLDMAFGHGGTDFLADTPAAVAQSVLTRLNLWEGEWWLDLTEGTPYYRQILGKPRGPGSPDQAIRARILGTLYVTQLYEYASVHDSANRSWSVSCKVDTAFGTADLAFVLRPPAATVPPLAASLRALPPPLRALRKA